MSATWPETARVLLPRLMGLARQIRPTFHLESVAGMVAPSLGQLGIELVIWDVDGTLTAHHDGSLHPRIADAAKALFAAPGLGHIVVSNCREKRFGMLAGMFPKMPILLGYETRRGPAYRVRTGREEKWKGPGAERAQDAPGELSPIRKPSRRLVKAAMDEYGFGDRPNAVLMVGDQYFTDIASARLAGIRCAKVRTLQRSSFPAPVRISQRLEAVYYRLRHGTPNYGLTLPTPEPEAT